MTNRESRGLRSVVVGTDFSRAGGRALRRVARLPLAGNARIHLVHVVALPSLTPLDVARDISRGELKKAAAALRRVVPGTDITEEIAIGKPAREIVRSASQAGAELLVAGRRGAGGFAALRLGSTAERLARIAVMPVLIVADPRATYGRALMAVDVEERPDALLHAAMRFLPPDGSAELLHVVWPYGEGYLRLAGASPARIRRHRAAAHEEAAKKLAAVLAGFRSLGGRGTTLIETGDPRRVVPRVIARRRPGLVILGKHARGGVNRAILGSVAQEVVQQAGTDVLLVPV